MNKLLLEDTSTVFDFFSTKCNLRRTENDAAIQAACSGHVEILKYFVEERKISDAVKISAATTLQGMANSIASNT